MFEVILSPGALQFYGHADQPLAHKLARCFLQLEQNPHRHNNIKRLSGKFAGRFRYRVGDWRVLYQIDDRAKQVHVLLIAHRGDVYE